MTLSRKFEHCIFTLCQRSCKKVMFSQVFIILFGGGVGGYEDHQVSLARGWVCLGKMVGVSGRCVSGCGYPTGDGWVYPTHPCWTWDRVFLLIYCDHQSSTQANTLMTKMSMMTTTEMTADSSWLNKITWRKSNESKMTNKWKILTVWFFIKLK